MEYLEALKEAVEIAKFPNRDVEKKVIALIDALDTDLSSGGYRSSEDFDEAYDALVDVLNTLEESTTEKPSVVVDGDEDVGDADVEIDDEGDEDDDEEFILDDEDDE